jgi:protein O-GlcNAc transferase
LTEPLSSEDRELERSALESYRAGDLQASEASYRELIARRPEHARAYQNLAMILRRHRQSAEAESLLREAVRLQPGYAIAWNALGAVLAERGENVEARTALGRALELEPRWAAPARNLGRLSLDEGRLGEARDLLERAVAAEPENVTPRFELGVVRALSGDPAGAIEAYQQVLKTAPDHVATLLNLGQILVHQQRRLEAGQRCFERALAVAPNSPVAHLGLAEVHRDSQPLESARHFRRARELDPSLEAVDFELIRLRAAICDWSERASDVAMIPGLVDRLGSGSTRVHPFHLNRFPLAPEIHQRAARLYAEQLEAGAVDERRELSFIHRREEKRRLRVGYLSSDFRQHAVGELVRDLFRHHDRERVEVWAYSLVNVEDPVRASIEAGCDRFEDLFGVSDRVAARRIYEDGIDILVDLSGYTVHARPRIPALRPAPVQVHWLGYLDTLGSKFTPWILADRVVLPEALATRYDESVVYLPDVFTAASPPSPVEAASREIEGLPPEAFVFCNFCHPSRIGPDTFDAWMRILDRVSEGVLWLYDAGRPEVRENLTREATARGLSASRLIFASKVPQERFLSRLAAADLFLDTLGYNAGATAIAALGAGLPVITCPGETYLGRMGASLCRAAGIEAAVAESPPAFVELAVELARDRRRLDALAASLRHAASASPLFDLRRFAGNLERAYEAMWWSHLEGVRPARLDL